MTDTEIRPALTAEEWEDVECGDMMSLLLSHYGDGVDALADFNAPRRDPDACRVALVALANHALPDGHPLKITRADVEALENASVIYRVGDTEVAQNDRATERIHLLAAKLAALLPPEGAER